MKLESSGAARPDAIARADRKFKLVVFDLDGTLVDSVHDVANAVNRVLASEGLAAIEESSRRQLLGEGARLRMKRAYEMRGRSLSEAELDARTSLFNRFYSEALVMHTRPYPGAVEVLNLLHERGLRIVVCTNKDERSARQVLAQLKLLPPVEDVAGSDTFGVQKPDRRHLTKLIERLGGQVSTTLMVGDSRHDVETARAAGVSVAVVNWGYTSVPPAQLGGDYLIERFSDLLTIVES